MKKLLSVILAIVISVLCIVPVFAETEAETVTEIRTADDLNNIRNNLSGKYILMNDIDLSSYENWEPIGSSETPFTGELDGNGYLIKNLKIQKILSDPENHIGLFGVAINSSFKKTIVENGYISISTEENSESSDISIFTGMIVAKTVGTDFSKLVRCSATGKIEVTGGSVVFAGGLIGIGTMDNGILSSTNYVDIDINTKACKQKIFIGGLLGGASESNKSYSESYFRIEKSANFGNILINNSVCFDETEIFAGGIAGFQISGNEMSECYNRGEISSSNSSGKLVIGGILGEAIWRLEKSYNTGNIIAPSNNNDKISSVCNIKTPYLYAPEGPAMAQDYIVYNCYCLNNGLLSCYQDSDIPYKWYDNIVTLSDTEMKTQNSFVGFDFDTVWEMEENGYPVLQNQPVLPKTEPTPDPEPNPEPNPDPTPDPEPDPEPVNNVKSAEIVYVPLKNRIVFGYGSSNLPGIVLKLTYNDGTEKTETIIRKDNGYFAGDENVFGSVDIGVVRYGCQTETLYINDERTSVEYDYFVIPPIFHMIISFLQGELFVIA